MYICISFETYKESCMSGLALVHRIRKQYRAIQEASAAKLLSFISLVFLKEGNPTNVGQNLEVSGSRLG